MGFGTIKKDNLEKYAVDFVEVYNKAWAGHGGLKQMAKEQVVILFKTMKPVMDERIIWFAYHNNQPVAMFINLPDLNQWFRHLNGKFGLLQKLKFLWLQKLLKPVLLVQQKREPNMYVRLLVAVGARKP